MENSNKYIFYYLCDKVYLNALKSSENLYKFLNYDSNFNCEYNVSFLLPAFIYHLFFYRITLSRKYSENQIKDVLYACLTEFISHMTDNLKEKNEIIDFSNCLFTMLNDKMVKLYNKDKMALNEISKSFLKCININNENETSYITLTLSLNVYFTQVITNSQFLLQ